MKQSKEVKILMRRKGRIGEQETFTVLRQYDEAGNISVKEFMAAF